MRSSLVTLIAILTASVLLWPQVVTAGRMERVTRVLDALATGLESYRAREGRYPDFPMVAGELQEELLRTGDLRAPLVNPDTGRRYAPQELEVDKVFYSPTPDLSRYVLEALAAHSDAVIAAHESP